MGQLVLGLIATALERNPQPKETCGWFVYRPRVHWVKTSAIVRKAQMNDSEVIIHSFWSLNLWLQLLPLRRLQVYILYTTANDGQAVWGKFFL